MTESDSAMRPGPSHGTVPRAGRRRSRGADTRDAIAEAATRRFNEVGYGDTTMRDIAQEVGMLPGSLYAHITSKEALLHEIIDSGIDEFIDALQPAVTSKEPADQRLRLAVRQHLEVVGRNPARTHVVFHLWRHLTGDLRAHVLTKRQRYQDMFRALVRDGMETGCFDPRINERVSVLGILGALNWAAEWYSPTRHDGSADVPEALADYLINGLMAASITPTDRSDPGPIC